MPTGRKSITAMGEQTEKETAASELTKLRASSNSLEASVNTGQSDALTGNPFADDQFVTSYAVGGSVDAEISKLMIPKIIKHAIGPEDGDPTDLGEGSGPYEHTFKAGKDFTDWLTFLKYLKDVGYYELYTDCRINQMSFTLTSQSVITYTLDILGITGESIAGEPSETLEENDGDKLFAWETTFNWESDITSLVDEFSFTHNSNLDGEDYGLLQVRRALEAQDREHTFSLTTQFDTDEFVAMKDDLKQGNIISTVSIEIGEASDGESPFLTIAYPKIKLTTVNAPVSGPGKITADIEGIALWDNVEGTNVIIKIVDDEDTAY